MTKTPTCMHGCLLTHTCGIQQAKSSLYLELDIGCCRSQNLIYVDQPTGTGFSYNSDLRDTHHNEAIGSNDLYDFLQIGLQKHERITSDSMTAMLTLLERKLNRRRRHQKSVLRK